MYGLPAGATTDHTDARWERDLNGSRGKVSGPYCGAGVGTEAASLPKAFHELHDVSVRPHGTRLSDEQLQRRDYGNSAGARATDLARRQMGVLDIGNAPRLGTTGSEDMEGRVGASSGFVAATQGHRSLEDERGVRAANTILTADDATSPYEAEAYAGVGSRFMGPGEPGQRKWHIGSDFVMVRPIEDISDKFMADHYRNPYAG